MLTLDRLAHKPILHSITCTLHPGKLYALIGPNGAGKTTLLKLISGIWPLTSGAISLSNQNLATLSRKERSKLVSLVPQNPSPQFPFTIREMIELGRYPHDSTQNVDWALKKTHLERIQSHKITKISCGQLQLTYIARALATESPLLLLDEPTAHLDLPNQQLIWNVLHSLISEGKTIIVTLHNLDEAKKYCSEALLLKKGTLIHQGPIKEALNPSLLTKVFSF